MAAQRAGQTQYQEIQVLVDGTPGRHGHPRQHQLRARTRRQLHGDGRDRTPSQFIGLNPQGGDNTAFIDEVAITAATPRSPTAASRRRHWPRTAYQYYAQRFALAVRGGGRGEQQRQRLHLRQSQCARRHSGRLHPRRRQHEPIRLPGRRHLQPHVPGRPAGRAQKHTRRSRCWSMARKSVRSPPPAPLTPRTKRPISRSRPGCTPSSSSA